MSAAKKTHKLTVTAMLSAVAFLLMFIEFPIPALIPSFCGKGFYGLHVHEAVLARGCKVTGATAHLVTAGVDEGPILLQKAVDVLPGDTPETLQRRVMEQAEWHLLPAATKMLAEEMEEAK